MDLKNKKFRLLDILRDFFQIFYLTLKTVKTMRIFRIHKSCISQLINYRSFAEKSDDFFSVQIKINICTQNELNWIKI